ncbi:MAG: pyrroline-5-carboxylate reductase [Woeseiaceae bacterium]|nr:pyrroline-5-carboxylate reductase [Woeseiaceae bacterium]
MTKSVIAFIGGGNMTRAIVGGMRDSGFAQRYLVISEPQAETRVALAKSFPGALVLDDNNRAVASASTVVLAVKPQVLPDVCRSLRKTAQDTRPLILSIAAGIRSDDIDQWLGGELAIVRVMPNQPALIRQGISALFANNRTSDAERVRAKDIMAAVGSVVDVSSESDIDAATAVSGSGPAYFFLLIDILGQTAVSLGIDPSTARLLAVETARGAAALALTESDDMEALIARVRSPGGTTAAALDSLDSHNVRDIFAEAITAARDRATELADIAHNKQK